jgi:hypothetical protein
LEQSRDGDDLVRPEGSGVLLVQEGRTQAVRHAELVRPDQVARVHLVGQRHDVVVGGLIGAEVADVAGDVQRARAAQAAFHLRDPGLRPPQLLGQVTEPHRRPAAGLAEGIAQLAAERVRRA